MSRFIIIIIAVALFCNSYSQTLEPIYIKDNKFYEGCNEFYPKALVYNVDIIERIGSNWVGPRRNYFDSTFVTGYKHQYGIQTGIKYIRQHFQTIKSLGFNIVKLSGFHVYNENDTLVGLYGRPMYEFYNGEPYYKEHFRLIAQVLDVAKELINPIILKFYIEGTRNS